MEQRASACRARCPSVANPKETWAARTALTVLSHRWGPAGKPQAAPWRPRLTEGTTSRGQRLAGGLLAEQQDAPMAATRGTFFLFFPL